MVFPEASEAKAAVLGTRFEAWLLSQEEKLSPDQERWLRMVDSQVRANADSMDEFTSGHFAFHPFTLMRGLPEAVRVFGGEDSLDSVLQCSPCSGVFWRIESSAYLRRRSSGGRMRS